MVYRSGVYHHTRGTLQGGHAIEIVGYGGTNPAYWIVKNSWGNRWGSSGFFQIIRGTNDCNFESMERGYNTGTGYRTMVANPPQPKLVILDDTQQPVNEGELAGDEVDNADLSDPILLEAAQFAASELNPVHCAGNVTLVRIAEAEKQVVSGMKFLMTIIVNSTECSRGAEVFFVQVYMSAAGDFTLQSSYSLGPLSENPDFSNANNNADVVVTMQSTDDSTWKTIAAVFIGISAVAIFVAFSLGCRLMKTSPQHVQPGEGGATYHQMTGDNHDL